MSGEFEDPRKTDLRQRCADAVDAAGYTVDAERTPIPYPTDSNFEGSIKADVSSTGTNGNRVLYFVRVDGGKPLPGWLSNIVVATFSMQDVEVYAVTESVGDRLRKTCTTVGCGLLCLNSSNDLELEVEYKEPDRGSAVKAFEKRLREVRRQLDTKVNANLQALQEQYSERKQLTEGMKESKRSKYLDTIESTMVRWREWGDELSSELDALAGDLDDDALADIKERIQNGTE